MVTTLGDLRRENLARTGSTSTGSARTSPFARTDAVDIHLPHEVVGILVAQALDWDAQRIIEAFTVALKQVTGQGISSGITASGGQTVPSAEPASKQADKVQGADVKPPVQDTIRAESHAVSEQDVQASDAGHGQSIAEVRQQFITLGELVLEAIEAVDRGSGEAVC